MHFSLKAIEPSCEETESGGFLLGLAAALSVSLTLWTLILLAGQWLVTSVK